MHELSIAQSIVEMVQQHVPPSDWDRVVAVRLKVGVLSGVVSDSLEFSFQAITSDTSFRRARLEIESIPFRIQCNACQTTTVSESGFAVCSQCGSVETKILSGSELHVSEIELEEPEEKKP